MSALVDGRRAQAIKDYKLTVEYKHLKQNSPGGIYVVPSFSDLRTWYGVIFVRRGMYANGIFKFRIELPQEYNDRNAWPRVFFTTRVYSPLVEPATGELDVKSAYPDWDPTKHYVVTVLTFLKKIFYIKDGFESYGNSPKNAAAAEAYANDAPEFLREVESCVRASADHFAVFDEPKRDADGAADPADPDAEDRSLRFVERDDGELDAFRDVLAGGPEGDGDTSTEAILRYLTAQGAVS